MRSQNRQSFKDQERANDAYQMNQSSKSEIIMLHEKMDMLRKELTTIKK